MSLLYPTKKVALESMIHSEDWKGCNRGVDVGYNTHYWAHHSSDEFTRGHAHINGMKSFWSYTKRRLAQFIGIPEKTFLFYLKKTECRCTIVAITDITWCLNNSKKDII